MNAVVLQPCVEIVGIALVDDTVVVHVGVVARGLLVVDAGEQMIEIRAVELSVLVEIDGERAHVDVIATPARHQGEDKEESLHTHE